MSALPIFATSSNTILFWGFLCNLTICALLIDPPVLPVPRANSPTVLTISNFSNLLAFSRFSLWTSVGLLHLSGEFKYYMVIVDASYRLLHVSLLASRNQYFARILSFMIRMRNQHPDYPIQTILVDNAGEFGSHLFTEFCSSLGINLQLSVAYVYQHNGLAEAHINRIQLLARQLHSNTNLPATAWGHAVLHANYLANLLRFTRRTCSPQQQILGHPPSISHLRLFACEVYVHLPEPQRKKLGPQRSLGIYVGCESASIVKYLDPATVICFVGILAIVSLMKLHFPCWGENHRVSEQSLAAQQQQARSSSRTKTCQAVPPHKPT